MSAHHVAVGLKAAGRQDDGVGRDHLQGAVAGCNDDSAHPPMLRRHELLRGAPVLKDDAMAFCGV